MDFDFTLVTPVYKDADRLAVYGPTLAEALSQAKLPVRWVISDDGSGEEQLAKLQAQAQTYRETYPHIEVFKLPTHRGKGAAVREAWKAFPPQTWLMFVDADGSITAETVLALMLQAHELGSGHALLGARLENPDTHIEQRAFRKIVNRSFSLLVRLCLGIACRDPQCGVKTIGQDDFTAIAPLLIEDGLSFDSELLVALKQHGIQLIETPIDWVEKPGGQVKPFRDAWPMFAALLKIAWRSRRGELRKT
ncbi:glycosyltransferase [Algisphaera agarilytica]|uniref:Glycosyltransferase involved in cell wall biosynthesis n=1 Tax=Algisphaera agarilytica TaxID=1385975 RepID=A0A7X0LLB9_9BACT|nr:glycosyltransferase [Algisphaera agarilytica]MBB6431340.1 glycosyltransferase involved in cell wall biosynthesis [Algisphaera agarilytica]